MFIPGVGGFQGQRLNAVGLWYQNTMITNIYCLPICSLPQNFVLSTNPCKRNIQITSFHFTHPGWFQLTPGLCL